MNKTIPIILGVLGILGTGVFAGVHIGDVISPEQIKEINFNSSDIQFLEENVEFINEITFNEETNEEIPGERNGLKIPIQYNFPILDEQTGDYIIEEIDGAMEMNFDGYNHCRGKGKTKDICLSELTDDIQTNIEAFQLNVEQELRELQEKQFQNEINILDL